MAVLVVAEDEDDIRHIMGRILRRAGHTVIETSDGSAALDEIRRARPDAVVSDIDMPRMSGVQLCEAVRADAQTATLPVIFVSGSFVPGDTTPIDAQATAILHKPFVPRELVACVDKVLATGHQQG